MRRNIFTLKHVWLSHLATDAKKIIFILKSFFLQYMEIMCLSIRLYLQVLLYAVMHKELNMKGLVSYETSVHILNSATGASQIKGLSGCFMGLEMRRRRR